MAVGKILQRLPEHRFDPGFVQRQDAADDISGVVFRGRTERAGNDPARVGTNIFRVLLVMRLNRREIMTGSGSAGLPGCSWAIKTFGFCKNRLFFIQTGFRFFGHDTAMLILVWPQSIGCTVSPLLRCRCRNVPLRLAPDPGQSGKISRQRQEIALPGHGKEIQFFFAGLSDLHDDHQDADDQQIQAAATTIHTIFLATSMPTRSMNMVKMIRLPRDRPRCPGKRHAEISTVRA